MWRHPYDRLCPFPLPPPGLSGGAPELLSVLLEGESLFNDASSIVLFEVFLKISLEGPGGGGGAPDADVLALLPGLMKHVGYLMISGALAGLMMGVLTRCGIRVGFGRGGGGPVMSINAMPCPPVSWCWYWS